jgi:hypothetical protein
MEESAFVFFALFCGHFLVSKSVRLTATGCNLVGFFGGPATLTMKGTKNAKVYFASCS